MNEQDRDETRLARVLAAVHADADPAVLARARARIAAGAEGSPVFGWLGSPAALVTACALLLVSAGASFAVLNAESSSRETTLMATLIGDDGNYGLPTSSTSAVEIGTIDSGEVSQ